MSSATESTTGDGTTPTEPEGSSGDGGSRTVPEDDLFHLLQNERRRAVVRYLQGRSGPIQMRDVAEQVAAWEHETTVEELSSEQRQRVYIALYQSHLDTLADAGVIEYNKPRGIVEPQPPVEHLALYLDVGDGPDGDDPDRDWTKYYLAASGVSTLLFGGTTAGFASSAYLTSMFIGLFTVAMFTSITIAEILTDFA